MVRRCRLYHAQSQPKDGEKEFAADRFWDTHTRFRDFKILFTKSALASGRWGLCASRVFTTPKLDKPFRRYSCARISKTARISACTVVCKTIRRGTRKISWNVKSVTHDINSCYDQLSRKLEYTAARTFAAVPRFDPLRFSDCWTLRSDESAPACSQALFATHSALALASPLVPEASECCC